MYSVKTSYKIGLISYTFMCAFWYITCFKAFHRSDMHVGVSHAKSVLAFEFLLGQRKEHILNYFIFSRN